MKPFNEQKPVANMEGFIHSANELGVCIGTVQCPHCNSIRHGHIKRFCEICGKDMFVEVEISL